MSEPFILLSLSFFVGFLTTLRTTMNLICSWKEYPKKAFYQNIGWKNLMQPVLLMLMFIRAERRETFHCTYMPEKKKKKKIHIFLLLVTRTMQKIEYVIFDRWKNFLVIFLISLWRVNMLWGIKRGYRMEYGNMMIETTYMKHRKGPSVKFCLKTFPRFDITESSK